jgi:hypothetical protein
MALVNTLAYHVNFTCTGPGREFYNIDSFCQFELKFIDIFPSILLNKHSTLIGTNICPENLKEISPKKKKLSETKLKTGGGDEGQSGLLLGRHVDQSRRRRIGELR